MQMVHLSPHELVAPPLPSSSGGNSLAQQKKKHLSYGCKWESGRAGEEGWRSDGQAQQPSPHRRFIKCLSASVALCLDWKAPQAKGSTCSWSPLIYAVAGAGEEHEANRGYRSLQLLWSLPLRLLTGPFYQKKMKCNNLQSSNVTLSCVWC